MKTNDDTLPDLDMEAAHIPTDKLEYILSQMEPFFNGDSRPLQLTKAKLAFRTLCGWSPRRIEKEMKK